MQEKKRKKLRNLLKNCEWIPFRNRAKELDDIRLKYKEREKLLVESKERELLTEQEYTLRLQQQKEELQKELQKKEEEQTTSKAAEEIARKDREYEQEKVRVLEKLRISNSRKRNIKINYLNLNNIF